MTSTPPFRAARSFLALSLAWGMAGTARAQMGNLDLNRTTPSQSQGMGGEISTGASRFSSLPESRIMALQSDQNPYVSDYPLVDSLYRIGPGDVFQLHYESTSLEKQVMPEGTILLNRIGVIHLKDLTLREAKRRILDRLATAYRREDVFVGLSRPKTMRIYVTGAVNAPGTHEVPGNFRLADAIRVAGGFAASAQKGGLRITVGEVAAEVNLQAFYLQGDLRFNPYLSQGAVVHVPFVDYAQPWVTVRRDGQSFTVQMVPGENLSDAVFKSYSFTPPVSYTAILVRELDGRDTLVSASEAAEYFPSSGSYLEIIPARQEIFVAGAVAAPGLQPHVSDRKVIQYISTAGLLTSSRVPGRIEVIRVNGKRISLPIQSADLRPGDVLFVRQNAEQKFLIYTPILLSFVSLTLAMITVFGLQ